MFPHCNHILLFLLCVKFLLREIFTVKILVLVMWVPVTMAWHVLVLQMEETALIGDLHNI
jgi:hypothetical protein